MNPISSPSTLCDVLRHGEPEGGDRFRGHRDDRLSAKGWKQMTAAVEQGNIPWQVIVTSPLLRCYEFAQSLADRHRLPLVIEPRLQEMSFGLWEGQTREELLVSAREQLIAFWQNPLDHPPPEGEHLTSVLARVASVWEDRVQTHQGQHMLWIAHGGIIRVLLAHLLGLPLHQLSRILVPYASLTRLRHDTVAGEPMPRLVFHCASLPVSPP